MESLIKFIFEMGALKKIYRTGWVYMGIPPDDTVGGHVFRTSMLGYILAKMENVDANKVVKMLTIHEIAESRIGDIHRVGRKYLNKKEAEKIAAQEQIADLPKEIREEFEEVLEEYEDRKTKESIVAKDADILETCVQAKEYILQGHSRADVFIQQNKMDLKTKSAKNLLEAILKSDGKWWQHIEGDLP